MPDPCPNELPPVPTTAELLADATRAYQRALQFASLGKGDRHLQQQQISALWDQIQNLKLQLAEERGVGDQSNVLAVFREPARIGRRPYF